MQLFHVKRQLAYPLHDLLILHFYYHTYLFTISVNKIHYHLSPPTSTKTNARQIIQRKYLQTMFHFVISNLDWTQAEPNLT